MITEAYLWKQLKPLLKECFRIESLTSQGIPDVFAVLPNGQPCFIELKVLRLTGKSGRKKGTALVDRLRPAQTRFIEKYNQYVPCLVIGAECTLEGNFVTVLINGKLLTAQPKNLPERDYRNNWKELLTELIKKIEVELGV